MSLDNSPFFFMKELSNEDLTELLQKKVRELKAEKNQSKKLNEELEESVENLQKTTKELEQAQEFLKTVKL